MYLPQFEYVRPGALDEALALLAEPDKRIRPLAGGTDLLLSLKEGKSHPEALLSLRDIPELHTHEYNDTTVHAGAAISVADLAADDLVRENPIFGDLRRVFASAPIRNRATIGGNICNAAACADLPPVLFVNDAQLTIANVDGQRTIPLERFTTGPRQTELAPGELLVSLSFRRRNPGSVYIKFGPRQAVNIAIVGVACALEVADKIVSRALVSVTAASPVPVFHIAESAVGQAPSQELWQSIAEEVADKLAPISDIRGSAEYRTHLAKVGTTRGLTQCLSRLEGVSDA